MTTILLAKSAPDSQTFYSDPEFQWRGRDSDHALQKISLFSFTFPVQAVLGSGCNGIRILNSITLVR